MPKRRGTRTSAFGVGRREGHDSSAFYERFQPPVISSDAFVQSYRPLDTIAAAVRRVTPSGFRVGPDQEVTVEEALTAHTINAARALHLDDRIGSIEAGKLADLTILDGDLLATPPEAIRSLPIWMTIVGGEVLHSA